MSTFPGNWTTTWWNDTNATTLMTTNSEDTTETIDVSGHTSTTDEVLAFGFIPIGLAMFLWILLAILLTVSCSCCLLTLVAHNLLHNNSNATKYANKKKKLGKL